MKLDQFASRFRTQKTTALWACLLLCLNGCATFQHGASQVRNSIASSEPEKAISILEPLAQKEGNDQLVYLLDYATALQQAKKYKESALAFQKAERVADVADYHSLSNVTASLALSENMLQYKGDDYEKVLINAMNAINYIEMGQLEGALVEVRRLNLKLYKYKTEAGRDYNQNPFASYLSGLIWEADRKWDDAYIAYKNTADQAPGFSLLTDDLIRAATRAKRHEEAAEWKKKNPEAAARITRELSEKKNFGSVVLVFQQGWGPRKEPRRENFRYPGLYPVRSWTQSARLLINGEPSQTTEPLFSVEQVAIKTLNDDYARLVGSRVAGIATKAVLADQLRQKNQMLGDIAWITMNALDQADLRQWSTLPQTFQIARVQLPPGKYKISAEGLDQLGRQTTEQMPEKEIEVRSGQLSFLTWRSVK